VTEEAVMSAARSPVVDPAWVAANVVHYHFSGIPISA